MVGCASSPTQPSSIEVKNDDYGRAYMLKLNSIVNDNAVRDQEEQLKKGGAQIVSVGQEYKVVIPADILFYENSPRIRWEAYALLNDSVAYIQNFNKIDVEVAGYTESTGDPLRDRALSLNRARKVADYMWGQKMGENITYIQGYVIPCQPGRLEISFRSVMM